MTSKESIPDIEKPEQQTFVKFFSTLPNAQDNTIRLFERDANQKRYYTVHSDVALEVAQIVYKTLSVVKYWGGDSVSGLATVSMSSAVAESFLREALLVRQHRIEIWEPRKNGGGWVLARKASPGNLQDVEEFLFLNSSMTASPVVMAVCFGTQGDNKTVGVSFADATIKQLGVSEFIDNELFSNLESLVIQLGVKECIIASNEAGKSYEITKVIGIMNRCGIVVTEGRKADFSTKDIEQDLNRLLEGEIAVTALPEFDMKFAMGSCACLIKYLSLLNDEVNFGSYRLVHHDLSQYMRLDASALSALNLMPSARDGSNKTMSLYGLLNKCKTAQGSRLLAQWLKQPLLSVSEIEQRQDLVEIFYNDTDLRQSLQETHLKNVPDLHRLAKRFQRGFATLQDVVRIYQVAIRLPALSMCLNAHQPMDEKMAQLMNETYTDNILKYSTKLEKLQELVESTIDLAALDNHEYVIKPDFDEELLELRQNITATRSLMDEEHERVGSKLRLDIEKKLKLEKHSLYGYCFRVGRTEASAIRNKSEYIEYATQKAGTYFTTSRLKDLSTSWNELCLRYERCQSNLVKEVISTVSTYCPVLELLGAVLAHMDVLVSFADVAVMAPGGYTRPHVHPRGTGSVILKEARHPCLEVQGDVSFIPNDVEMIKDDSEYLIVTGPNMGGKSTYIRQIGVIALMAQVGSFVPCTEATLCVFDSILARVGAGDSQLKGVSTFMAEMLETATILKTATSHSLVIIDELGRGTSTYDGFGLAWAISEHIATKIRAFCLFATHFHELTALADTVSHVKNLNVAVHIEEGQNITLLYKVNKGVCDQSFGIHVAELAQFPSSVVKLAKRKASELEQDKEEPIAKRHSPQDVQNGSELLQKVMRELGQTSDIDSMNDDALVARVKAIREKYQGDLEQNPYLRELLAGL